MSAGAVGPFDPEPVGYIVAHIGFSVGNVVVEAHDDARRAGKANAAGIYSGDGDLYFVPNAWQRKGEVWIAGQSWVAGVGLAGANGPVVGTVVRMGGHQGVGLRTYGVVAVGIIT